MTYKLVGRKIIGGQEVLADPANIGSANVVLVDVDCESSVYVGAAVIMQASGIAKNGIATSLAESNIIGVVESKGSISKCNIRLIGQTGDIFTGLDVTKEYYLSASTPGAITTTIPTTSGHVVLRIGQPFSATSFVVIKGQRTVRL